MQRIEDIVCPAPRGVLSLTGAGGKTSLMFHLARVLSETGKRVLVTTTTKIFPPSAGQCARLLVDSDPEAVAARAYTLCGKGPVTAAARHEPASGKLIGFAPQAIDIFRRCGSFDWVLVEADGSARRPLKAHAPHEPVIPDCSTVLVAVVGLEVLGRPLGEEWVFRPEIASGIMGLAAGDTIGASALTRLIVHPDGVFTGAPPDARRFLFLNQADTPQRLLAAAQIAAASKEEAPAVAEALLVGQALYGVTLHAIYPLGAP